MLAAFIPICIYSDTIVFNITMSVLSLIAVYEMVSCVGAKSNLPILISSCLLGASMPMIPYFTSVYTLHIEMVCYIVYMILVFTFTVFSRGKADFSIVSAAFMSVFYVSVSFTSIILLRKTGEYLYLLAFIGPWVSDTFAYIVGRLIGKHKLIPEVSPKKTVEGSIGGIIATSAVFVLYGFVVVKLADITRTPNVFAMAIAGAVVSVISQIGDLTASAIKRRYGVKDYGKIFPGHGGVMDRFDSVLLVSPVLYILSELPGIKEMLI